MSYRDLEVGEVIQEGDEISLKDKNEYQTCLHTIGATAETQPLFKFRRPIADEPSHDTFIHPKADEGIRQLIGDQVNGPSHDWEQDTCTKCGDKDYLSPDKYCSESKLKVSEPEEWVDGLPPIGIECMVAFDSEKYWKKCLIVGRFLEYVIFAPCNEIPEYGGMSNIYLRIWIVA